MAIDVGRGALIAVAAKKKSGAAPPATAPPTEPVVPPAITPSPPVERFPERLEVDVSTHTVAVTSAFAGTEIVLFGTVANSRQESAELGYYDVIVVVDGAGAPSIVRRKTRLGGLWVNTEALRFDGLPLYSAVASSRPIDEIAEPRILAIHEIGFDRARMYPGKGVSGLTPPEVDAYKSAVIRLKERDRLYVRDPYGVAFTGRSLFRATVRLPANIPVGPLDARVFLFRDGQLLATTKSSVMLERQGLERLIFDFAYDHPVWYGMLAALIAATAGLAGSFVFRRTGR